MRAIPAPAVATMRARQARADRQDLRVTSTGGIPPDNPFVGAGTGVCAMTGATTAGNHCRETFAWGLRNPFPHSAGSERCQHPFLSG